MTEANSRLSREMQKRELEERPKTWLPPETLPKPDRQPGYAYRWVRVSTLGQADPRNLSGKLREGWEPVSVEEQPQFRMLIDPTSRFKDNIEIGGLLLCKTPVDMVKQRNAYYQNQTDRQAEAVDNTLMRQSDPRMPLYSERKSSTTFGKGA